MLTTLWPDHAHVKYGYTLKEIADYLSIHYTTVSNIVKEVEGGADI
ncbi:MAG: helix-turn-helix domain-containing protein [Nitrospirae bacterium]|nr:helix-turn-helix domain-containing protein [Nitrospirota bacterium]